MADPRSAGIFAALRAAAHPGEERHLVGLENPRERERVMSALAAEGQLVEVRSTRAALDSLAAESFELAVLDLEEGRSWSALSVGKELRPFTDLVFLMSADPVRCGECFAADVAAVVPRPLSDNDALLRAHLRWLASCRRSRSRGLLLRNALSRHGPELTEIEPALAKALAEVAVAGDQHEPTVMVIGDADLVRVAGGRPAETAPDVVVVGLGAADNFESRLREARTRASGAAVVLVDGAPSGERMSAALYGGVRGYLVRAQLPALGRVVAGVATRRRAEVNGRRLVETLARFGVLDEVAPGGRAGGPVPTRDVDARLLSDATSASGPFVPSGHEVLVVDDEAVVLTVLREALRRGGYRVTTAASGEEAIDLMRRRRFDLVLTDKNLPGASGLEVLRVGRSLDPPPAVVLITGYSSYDSAVEALDIGAQDYIEKPIRDLEQLRFRIRRALSRRDEQLSRAPIQTGAAAARVLLVEVEGGRRRLMAEFLGRSCQVTAVADGAEAMRRLQEERFDVVLADRNLPGLSGLRVIEQAQRLLPHCACVLYTAYPSYETVKEAFELGVDAFCVRPSEDLKSLADKVAGALRSRGGILLG
jgi:CheY-like chemotaxis protein